MRDFVSCCSPLSHCDRKFYHVSLRFRIHLSFPLLFYFSHFLRLESILFHSIMFYVSYDNYFMSLASMEGAGELGVVSGTPVPLRLKPYFS